MSTILKHKTLFHLAHGSLHLYVYLLFTIFGICSLTNFTQQPFAIAPAHTARLVPWLPAPVSFECLFVLIDKH